MTRTALRNLFPSRLLRAVSVFTLAAASLTTNAFAQDLSPAPILQWFEGRYETQRERTADLFLAGYGGVWIPPTGRAETGGLSVGYDVFDRFDLGSAKSTTLYGSKDSLKRFTDTAHRAGANIYADLIWNHNGFADTNTPGFAAAGGYPGFVLSHPGIPDGDFHDIALSSDELTFRLAGLIDIDQSQNIQLIRHPVAPGDPDNIPAGTVHNIPNPTNTQFYPDRDLGGTVVFDPARNTNVTLYDYNTADPLAGDVVTDNATGVLIRNVRWMIQEVGVDGFRVDAGRHFPRWVLPFLDEAMYLASNRTNLDGSPVHAYAFTEVGFDSASFQQDFIRLDIDDNNPGQLGGNRDALDFNFFGAVNNNLQNSGIGNDWNSVVNASIDLNDDGFMNGSQGVKFVESHDDFGPGMINVAYAYMLMLPGNANVYYNAQQNYHPLRDFPKDGSGDSLGNFGDTRTKLVDIRTRYGRGNFLPRFIEKENYAYEREKSALVLLSNRNDAGFDARTVQTAFDPGTWLVEQTGNAANNADIPEFLEVQANGSVNARFLRNDQQDQGYLIYGPQTPVSSGGIELTGPGVGSVLAGATPPNFVGGETEEEIGDILRENGGARLADLQVINGDTFTVRLATQAVTLDVPGIPGGVRDPDADGDFAVVRINDGLDLNGNGSVDNVTPNEVAYGFESFVTTNTPGFGSATGDGLYEQAIDATQLPEGLNFVTVRAFRHRDPGTGGDDGPAVFSEFKEVLWVDLLPPEVEFLGQDTFDEANNGIDFAFQSTDGTAEAVHIFRNVGAERGDAFILQQAMNGANQANRFDGDYYEQGTTGVETGNQAFTVVTFERTGNYSIQRFAGIGVTDGAGTGFGDINSDGLISSIDINAGFPNLDQIIFSRNVIFDPAADTNADGLVDTRDLLDLAAFYEGAGAEPGAAAAYLALLHKRGDQDASATLDTSDIDVLYANLGTADEDDLWTGDLDVDGQVTQADVLLLITGFLRSVYGDGNLSGQVEQGDLDAVLQNWGGTNVGYAGGDYNGSGQVEQGDLDAVLQNWGQTASPDFALNPGLAQLVPEPASAVLVMLGGGLLARRRH